MLTWNEFEVEVQKLILSEKIAPRNFIKSEADHSLNVLFLFDFCHLAKLWANVSIFVKTLKNESAAKFMLSAPKVEHFEYLGQAKSKSLIGEKEKTVILMD